MTGQSYEWKDGALTINGVSVPGFSCVAVDGVPEEPASIARTASGTYEITLEATIENGADLWAWADALMPKIRGVSDFTLAQRASYRSRKGRSAFRRLIAKGFLGIAKLRDLPWWIPIPPDGLDLSDANHRESFCNSSVPAQGEDTV